MPKTYVELGIDAVRRPGRVLHQECGADIRLGDRSGPAKAAQGRRYGGGAGDERVSRTTWSPSARSERQVCAWAPTCMRKWSSRPSGWTCRSSRSRPRAARIWTATRRRSRPSAHAYAPKASLGAVRRQDGGRTSRRADRSRKRATSCMMLKDFIVKNNVVSIPSNDEALVAEAPPYNRSNAAFIKYRGPLRQGRGIRLQYRAAGPEVEQGRTGRLHSRARRRCCSPRCTRCGRDISCSSCIPMPIRTSSKGLWVGYAFAEGWAHYCEEMMVRNGPGQR